MNIFIIIFTILGTINCIELKSFIHDTFFHFGYKSIAFYMNEDNPEICEMTELTHIFWFHNIEISFLQSPLIPVQGPIFVTTENETSLKNVQYAHNQTWFMPESNLKHLDSWKLRMDSMIFLWEKSGPDEVIIKVFTVKWLLSKVSKPS